MKLTIRVLPLILFGLTVTQAQIPRFDHIIVIVQENRTPDNLFQGLCRPPFGSAHRCSTTPDASQYDIKTTNWLDKDFPGGTVHPRPIDLANTYDLGHSHSNFLAMCDFAGAGCRMDGAADINCGPTANCPLRPQFRFVSNRDGIVNPYLQMATQYGWANYMFQTNQGPSFPAHQFIFGGTSAPTAADDAAGIFASENLGGGIGGLATIAGCIALTSTTVTLINPPGVENQKIYPCFEHLTMGDLLQSPLSWRYYTPSAGLIWTAPDAIQHICQSTGPGGDCVGPEWTHHVDLNSADVLNDIANCELRSVSWVIPTGLNSDHAKATDGGGPSWVASIVNAIGNSRCGNDNGYWNNTAIFITWDDWGGWYDHVPPPFLPEPQGDYQYGFRVPLIVVSAYTPANYINNARHDFGSILRFIEQNFSIPEGALNFADKRSTTDLTNFFDLSSEPRRFRVIDATKNAAFFLHDKRPPTDPDDDDPPAP